MFHISLHAGTPKLPPDLLGFCVSQRHYVVYGFASERQKSLFAQQLEDRVSEMQRQTLFTQIAHYLHHFCSFALKKTGWDNAALLDDTFLHSFMF